MAVKTKKQRKEQATFSQLKAQTGAAALVATTRGRAASFGRNGPSKKARLKKACRRGDPRKGKW